jgi:PAS domain S-box-containing protein
MASARPSLIETRLIETSLVEQHARAERLYLLESIFEQLPDAKVLCDRNQQIVAVNRAAERLLRVAAQELIGESLQYLFQGDLFQGDLLHRRSGTGLSVRPTAGERAPLPSGTLKLRPKDGRERMVMIRTAEVCDDASTIQGMVATIQELTQEARPTERRIVAASHAMLDLLACVRKVAASEVTSVLLQGENGTGKDLIAQALHHQSARQSKPFLAVNCAAIPENLLESELFGYEKGAFTDARAQKRGLLELADQGTLFLDEIGEMPFSLQVKLLRAIEDQTFRRLGGVKDIHVNIRIIAASNTDLGAAVEEGEFRQDLYYRLNVVQLVVPALRDRRDDILPLARFFIQQYNHKFKRHIDGISPEGQRLMLAYNWPGNVRELRNAIERATIFEETDCILPASLHIAIPPTALPRPAVLGAQAGSSSISRESVLREQERNLVIQALEATTGNQSRAARSLGITRDVLRYKMKKFNLSVTRTSVPVE